jgi:hypothetical protein
MLNYGIASDCERGIHPKPPEQLTAFELGCKALKTTSKTQDFNSMETVTEDTQIVSQVIWKWVGLSVNVDFMHLLRTELVI